MKLISWNVNGIRAVVRKEVFQPFLDTYQPDILCLQETKAHPDQLDLTVEGYQTFWNSAGRKGYSGTAIFSRTAPLRVWPGFNPELLVDYNLVDDYGDTTLEGRVLTAEFEDFFVVTVYTPNAKDDLSRIPMRMQWDPAFAHYCAWLQKTKPVITCGDFNVAHTPDDLARPKPNEGKKGFTQEERSGFQYLLDQGFVDSFRLFHQGNGYYTWWSHFGQARTRNIGWRIDYVLVSQQLVKKVAEAQIYPEVLGSDHCPVGITIN